MMNNQERASRLQMARVHLARVKGKETFRGKE